MELRHKTVGELGVIEIEGRLDASNATQLKDLVTNWPGKERRFVLDLSGMDFIDSTGLGSIVACLKSVTRKGGEIRIAALQAKPRMVFEITRVYKIFEIYDGVEAAIESFER